MSTFKSFFIISIAAFVSMLSSSCMTPATRMGHSGDFSNIRSEITLTNGTTFVGYASSGKGAPSEVLHIQLPGDRATSTLPLSQVLSVKTDVHEFVVKRLKTPNAAIREGKAEFTTAMVKRLGNEADAIQIFEYKYPLRNPKSPLNTLHTTWYAIFPGQADRTPLSEIGSAGYYLDWAQFVGMYEGNKVLPGKAPVSLKTLLELAEKVKVPYSLSSPISNMTAE